MRKIISYLLIVYSFSLTAQTSTTVDVTFFPTDTIKAAYQPNLSQPYIFIASSFGSDKIVKDPRLDSVKDFLIKEIVLVYSRYHKADKFNQSRLNENRWINLHGEYPTFFENGSTKLRNVCQDGLTSDTTAKKLSHGFFIYFENRGDSLKRKAEITEISKMVMALGIDTSESAEPVMASPAGGTEEILPLSETRKIHSKFKKPMRTRDPKACRQPFYGKGTVDLESHFKEKIKLTTRQKKKPKKLNAEVRLRLDFNGFIKSAYILAENKKLVEQIRSALSEMNVWNPAVRNGITIKSDVKFNLQCLPDGSMGLKGEITVAKSLSKCGTAPDEELFDFSERPKETLMPTVFEVPDREILRNVVERHPALDSVLLVVDLTGSMGPYIAQVLDLMADLVINDDPHVSCISLFNDGDSKADRKKEIGNTEGIIILDNDITIDRLGKSIIKSMKRGSGGDCMENNMEAVIKGLDKCRGCRDIIMVADNLATPRDISLVNKVERPIHFILCGVYESINTHYLDLARDNKGFVHTGKSDVSNLHLLKENEVIIIDGYSYQLKRGKFRLLNIM